MDPLEGNSLSTLPNELIDKILEELWTYDRVKCRLVCRRLHSSINRIGLLPRKATYVDAFAHKLIITYLHPTKQVLIFTCEEAIEIERDNDVMLPPIKPYSRLQVDHEEFVIGATKFINRLIRFHKMMVRVTPNMEYFVPGGPQVPGDYLSIEDDVVPSEADVTKLILSILSKCRPQSITYRQSNDRFRVEDKPIDIRFLKHPTLTQTTDIVMYTKFPPNSDDYLVQLNCRVFTGTINQSAGIRMLKKWFYNLSALRHACWIFPCSTEDFQPFLRMIEAEEIIVPIPNRGETKWSFQRSDGHTGTFHIRPYHGFVEFLDATDGMDSFLFQDEG